jgi:hypothetical protein
MLNVRSPIFNLYNITVGSRWHFWFPDTKQLATMPAKRQTPFQEVYADGNMVNDNFAAATLPYKTDNMRI